MGYEIDAACKRGVAAYLAEQHSFFRNKTLAKATLTGAIGSGLLFGADRFRYLAIRNTIFNGCNLRSWRRCFQGR